MMMWPNCRQSTDGSFQTAGSASYPAFLNASSGSTSPSRRFGYSWLVARAMCTVLPSCCAGEQAQARSRACQHCLLCLYLLQLSCNHACKYIRQLAYQCDSDEKGRVGGWRGTVIALDLPICCIGSIT